MNADYQVLEAKGLFCFSVILWLSVVDVGTMQPATTKGTNQIAYQRSSAMISGELVLLFSVMGFLGQSTII
jgi:hypothetical protein